MTGLRPPSFLDSIRWTRRIRLVLALALLALVAGLAVRPIVLLYSRSFTDGAGGLRRLVDMPGIGGTIRTTFVLALGSTVIALVLGILLAWCTTRLSPRVQAIVTPIPILPLAVPPVAFVVGWSFLLSPQAGYLNRILRDTPFFDSSTSGPFDIYSRNWIIVLTGLNLTAFVYTFMLSAFRELSTEYEAAGLVSGGNQLYVFRRIVLPLLRPPIVYSAGTVFLLGMGQFTAPLLLGPRAGVEVLTTRMFHLREQYPIDYALGAALGLPILLAGVLVVVAQRRLLSQQMRWTTSSGKVERARSTYKRWPLVPIVAYALVAVVLPLLAIAHVAVSKWWTGTLTVDGLTFDNVNAILSGDTRASAAVGNTVRFSAISLLILLPLGFVLSMAMSPHFRVPRPIRSVLDMVATLPLSVPAALMGFGLLFAYAQQPVVLYGTPAVMVVTYVTIMIPYAVRSQMATMTAQGGTYIEAAKVSGASLGRVVWKVMLPMGRRSIAGGAAIMVVLMSHEFTASLMVRSLKSDVMGTVLYDEWTRGSYPRVAALALVMVVVTAIGVVLAFALGGRKSIERL